MRLNRYNFETFFGFSFLQNKKWIFKNLGADLCAPKSASHCQNRACIRAWVVRGGRGGCKKQSKMTKNSVHCTPYLRNYTSHDCHLCLMMIFSDVFFTFLKILIFWVHRGAGRGKKQSRMTKIMSVVLHISGTIHHMIVIYGANV